MGTRIEMGIVAGEEKMRTIGILQEDLAPELLVMLFLIVKAEARQMDHMMFCMRGSRQRIYGVQREERAVGTSKGTGTKRKSLTRGEWMRLIRTEELTEPVLIELIQEMVGPLLIRGGTGMQERLMMTGMN